MERATATPFPELMRVELFHPLGMLSTFPDDPRVLVPNRSRTYTYDPDRGVVNAPSTDHSYKIPGGGFLSSAIDIALFGAAVAKPGWLDEETLGRMLEPMQTHAGEQLDYAMGWVLRTDAEGRRLYGHGGNQLGGRAYLLVYPDVDVALAILSNIGGAPIGRAEAMIIAEPFVRHVEGVVPQSAALDPSGTYVLTAFDERLEREITARVEIRERFGKWSGSLSVFIERFNLDSILVDDRSVRAIGFDGKRLMLMEFDVATDGTASGIVRHGQRTRQFMGRHTPFSTAPG
jgi:CubicO group peptidase (beta-lactamase class C family)